MFTQGVANTNLGVSQLQLNAGVIRNRPVREKNSPLKCMVHCAHISLYSKSKVRPRTGQEGPEWEKSYSSTLSLTSALDVGGWSTPRPGRLTSGKDPVPIV